MSRSKRYLSDLLGVKVFSLNVSLEDGGNVVVSPIKGTVDGISNGMLTADGYLVAMADSAEAVAGLLSRGGSVRVTQISRPQEWTVVYPVKVALNFQALYGAETAELMRLLAEDFAAR